MSFPRRKCTSAPKASVVHSQRDSGVATKTCQRPRPVTCPFRVTEQKHAGQTKTNGRKGPKDPLLSPPLLVLPTPTHFPFQLLRRRCRRREKWSDAARRGKMDSINKRAQRQRPISGPESVEENLAFAVRKTHNHNRISIFISEKG